MKEKLFVIVFMFIIFGSLFLNIFSKKSDVSYYERRKLAKFPEITLNGLLDKEVTSNLDSYITDHFIFRNEWRTLKTKTEFAFNKSDVNNLFYYNHHYFKYETDYSQRQINKFTEKINYIYDEFLSNMNVYYSIIPEKNYYLSSDKYKKFNYDGLFQTMDKINSNIKYIDITHDITLDSYYYTDHHLRQDKIIPSIKTLSQYMNFDFSDNFEIQEYPNFYGAYYGQLLVKKEGEKLYLLHNDIIDNATVYNIEDSYDKVYNYDAFGTIDSYDIFLSGATPYIEIINNNIKNGKELIIFRDSYTSSFAPLMLNGYEKITLLDLRYSSLKLLLEKVKLTNQDVLFLYSTSLINGSDVLKVF